MSEDPLGLLAGDTNYYAYVTNNPTSFRDPHGLFIDPGTTTVAIVGFAALVGIVVGGDQTPTSPASPVLGRRKDGDLSIYHYTNEVGRAGIERMGLILPNAGGYVYLTPTIYSSGLTAQAELALSNTPTGFFRLPRSNLPDLVDAGRVPPGNGQPGGGVQFVVRGPVSINGAVWVPIGR